MAIRGSVCLSMRSFTLSCKTKIVQEKTLELKDPIEYFDMVKEINAWSWGVLETPNEVVNLNIVREFYENSKHTDGAPMKKLCLVQGLQVPFDRDVMHAYI